VGHRAGLDNLIKGKTSCSSQDSNSVPSSP